MNTYSQSELDAKINAFMARKMDKFPDLKDRHMTTIAPVRTRRMTKRQHMLLPLQLRVQY